MKRGELKTDRKGNKKRILQFKNEYGLYFVFTDRVFEDMAKDRDIPLRKLKDFAIFFYIHRYIIGGHMVVVKQVVDIASKLGINFTYPYMKRLLKYFYEEGYLDYYGMRYRTTEETANLIKGFDYFLHHYLVNFYALGADKGTIIGKKLRNDSQVRKRNRERKERALEKRRLAEEKRELRNQKLNNDGIKV